MDDDGKPERRDREVMPAQAHREKRQKHPGETGESDAGDEGRPERHAELDDQQGRDVSAEAIEGGMAEIELAGIAEDEIQPEREQYVDRANRQVGAPIAVVENQRQHGNGDDREQ